MKGNNTRRSIHKYSGTFWSIFRNSLANILRRTLLKEKKLRALIRRNRVCRIFRLDIFQTTLANAQRQEIRKTTAIATTRRTCPKTGILRRNKPVLIRKLFSNSSSFLAFRKISRFPFNDKNLFCHFFFPFLLLYFQY